MQEPLDPNIEVRRYLESKLNGILRGTVSSTPEEKDVVDQLKTEGTVVRDAVRGLTFERTGSVVRFQRDLDISEVTSDLESGLTLVDDHVRVAVEVRPFASFVGSWTVRLKSGGVLLESYDSTNEMPALLASAQEFVVTHSSLMAQPRVIDTFIKDGIDGTFRLEIDWSNAPTEVSANCEVKFLVYERGFRIRAGTQLDARALRQRGGAGLVPEDFAVSFYEWRGRRHRYLPLVESYFIFDCYGARAELTRQLWGLLDRFLHDPGGADGSRIRFGKLFVYYCLRAAVPQLHLELSSRLSGVPRYSVSYRMMYWDQ